MITKTALFTTGFFRVHYDINNWKKIINYLNTDAYTNIHAINRAQIIDDAYYLMTKRRIFSFIPVTFFELIAYLKQETDYIAWYPMKRILPDLWSFSRLPLPDSKVIKVSSTGFHELKIDS